MQSSKTIHVVSCHAEGEVGDVVIGGVLPPPGESLWEQRSFLARDQSLRNFLLNEPRGGVFRHVNLLVPPKHPDAHLGFIIMEPEDTPPMSGSNSICVATVALDTGIVPMREPVTELTLEAPGGIVRVTAHCRDGKAEKITIHNLPSYAASLDNKLVITGHGCVSADIAYGGDSFVIVDAESLGFSLSVDEAPALSQLGVEITRAANEQIGFQHPVQKDWSHISFCLFAGPIESRVDSNGDSVLTAKSAVVVQPGKIDRSPTGTAVSARMAVMHARGEMKCGDQFLARSIIDSEFLGEITGLTKVGEYSAVLPAITGRAWITGTHQHMLEPSDPWPEGYRIADTWPQKI